MTADKTKIFPEGSWVKAKSGRLRYITRHKTKDCFEDDGELSGEPPSPYCHYDNYEPIKLMTFIEWLSEVDGRNAEMKRIYDILSKQLIMHIGCPYCGSGIDSRYYKEHTDSCSRLINNVYGR